MEKKEIPLLVRLDTMVIWLRNGDSLVVAQCAEFSLCFLSLIRKLGQSSSRLVHENVLASQDSFRLSVSRRTGIQDT